MQSPRRHAVTSHFLVREGFAVTGGRVAGDDNEARGVTDPTRDDVDEDDDDEGRDEEADFRPEADEDEGRNELPSLDELPAG
mmetsp:Transcript_32799/g.55247  ORF Transcript_32799/g.55247 Transcript_32799/m.55247 type:complete len:82 (+) Transcript_32799:106-351(+)